MAVLLLILKIIGIILLILLGLILLILAVVLFVPVRYQVSGSIGEKTTVRIAVTWLLHAVSWRAAYEEEGFSSQLRIFGITRKGKKPDDGEPGEDDREDGAEEPEERSAADVPLTDGEQKTGSILADGEQGEAERFDERQAKKVCAGRRSRILRSIRNWNKRIRLCAESSAAGCFGGYGSVSVHSLQDSSQNCGSFVPA